MKDELVAEVMQQMLPYLDNAQLKQLRLGWGLRGLPLAFAAVRPSRGGVAGGAWCFVGRFWRHKISRGGPGPRRPRG